MTWACEVTISTTVAWVLAEIPGRGHEVAEVLLAFGAEVESRDKWGNTPPWLAFRTTKSLR